MAGLNGPLNYGERKFSATLGDPTHAIFYPQN